MAPFSKQQLPVSAQKKSKFNLDSQHITTSDFMQIQPVYYRHMIPGEKINVNVQSLARLSPLVVPTYGRANLNLRAFFVPYRTVFHQWNEFIADTIASNFSVNSLVSSPPLITSEVIIQTFLINAYSTEITPYTNQPYDFSVITSGTTKYYKLNKSGRVVYKILNSLGYPLIPDTTSSSDIRNAPLTFNALGLLSFVKIYMDWYSLSQYQNSALYLRLAKLFEYNTPSSPLTLSITNLTDIFDLVLQIAYNQDFVTSQWDNPVAPVTGLQSSYTFKDISLPTIGDVTIKNSTNGTPVVDLAKAHALSEYAVHTLHAINNYVRKHQMSGARAIDRMLVEYGIQLRSEKLNRSVYIGNSVVPLQIGDVTSHADTSAAGSPSNLGDYAGKGLLSGNNNFDYECEEFGMFCICSTIIPAVDYVQGYDRNNRHIDKLDFFTPSMDCTGVQSCEKGEMYISPNMGFFGTSEYASTYSTSSGFLPRYYEYKIGRSRLSGDLSLPTMNEGKDSWHLFRLFSDSTWSKVSDIAHSADLCLGTDAAQYDRIFAYTDEDFDHFFMFYNFNVNSIVPALPLYDTYVFEGDEDKPQITMEPNGSKLN